MYNLLQGLKNIGRNKRLSFASVATVAACIFLFCIFVSIMANLNLLVRNVETKVGITVFFDENLPEERIQQIGAEISKNSEVNSVEFTSAEEAWSNFRNDYFKGHEELAEGFAQDNPLKDSASYTVFLNRVEDQDSFVQYLQGLQGVRQVNYSSKAGSTLSAISRAISIISLAIILLLLLVSLFIVSNTISVSAEFRKNETAIMRLIGATNAMIRAPFVIEGIVLGLIGAVVPLILIFFLYHYAVGYASTHISGLNDIVSFIPIGQIFPYMLAGSLAIGLGMGFLASFVSMRKYLRV